MPYLREKDQYYWDPYRQQTGATFLPDGSDYDPSLPRPKLSDANRVLSKHFRPKTLFQVTVVGYNLIYSSSEQPISAFSFYQDLNSIEYAAVTGGHGGGGKSLEDKIAGISGFSLPDDARITGIYFRALD